MVVVVKIALKLLYSPISPLGPALPGLPCAPFSPFSPGSPAEDKDFINSHEEEKRFWGEGRRTFKPRNQELNRAGLLCQDFSMRHLQGQ